MTVSFIPMQSSDQYIYIYIYIYIYTQVCMCVYMCMQVCVHVCAYTCVFVYECVHICVFLIFLHVCTYMHMYVKVSVCVFLKGILSELESNSSGSKKKNHCRITYRKGSTILYTFPVLITALGIPVESM